jgi:hypothetical protein
VGQGRRVIIWAVGAGCLAGAGYADAQAIPGFGQTVELKPVSGTVQIRVPSGPAGFVRLTAPEVVPLGTVVDTTAGRVSLTSATPINTAPRFQTGQFFGGIFRVEQTRAAGGLVDLVLRDNLPRTVCLLPVAHGAALSHRILGLLRGVAKGRFRTIGRFSAATVRGTNWGVRDRCDGTLTVVRAGVVAVRDFVRRKTVIVRAGQTYLAGAP